MKFMGFVTICVTVLAFADLNAKVAEMVVSAQSKNIQKDAKTAVAQEESARGKQLAEWILSHDTVTELMWKKGFDDFRGKVARIEGVVKDVREGYAGDKKRTFVLLEIATHETSGKADLSIPYIVCFNLKETAKEEAANWSKGMKLAMRGTAWRFFNAHFQDGCVEFNESERVKNTDCGAGNSEVPAANTARQKNADAEERVNRIVGEMIDDELVIRLRFKGHTESECNELKRQLMAKFRELPVETRVEASRLTINEIIRAFQL